MLTLQQKVFQWENERLSVLKKFLIEMTNSILFIVYATLKLVVLVFLTLIEKPKMRKQIAPGKFEEV